MSTAQNISAAEIEQDGLPQPQRTFAFLTIGVAIMMAVLDGSIVNVALPMIANEQQVSAADAIWVINAYQLAVVISLLPFAALGEAIGFRRVYFGGLLTFACASALCATSDSVSVLSVSRALQGLGAGAIMSINGAMVRQIMPAARMGRGISAISLIVGCSAAAGPTVAGGILAIASWQWLFLLNIPICIAICFAGYVSLPRTAGNGQRFDIVRALLNAVAFGFLISALNSVGRHGAGMLTIVQFLIAGAGFVALGRRQHDRKAPLLPVDLLGNRVFAQSIVASICSFVAQFLAFVSLPFYFHDELGLSAVQIGLLLTPWPLATAFIAPFAGRLADAMSPNLLGAGGMALFASGFMVMALLPPEPAAFDIAWRLGLCGIGFGLFQAPNNKVIIMSASRARSGGASGMQSTARVLGQSIGAAIAAIIMALFAGSSTNLTIMSIGAGFALLALFACFWRGKRQFS
jgi:DHA2 family multidrug resistance protein-like MFS transporter